MRKTISKLLLPALVAAILVGCANHANQQVYTVPGYRVVVTQPQPVVVAQPRVVVTQPRIVVRQPAPVVYRRPVVYTQPVMHPARVYVGNVGAYRHCNPGSTRHCDAYCGGGTQTCNPDGMSWGACIEHSGIYHPVW